MNAGDPFAIRSGKTAEILALRHAILRAGLPPESAQFPGDDLPTTHHLVAETNARIIGCVTLMASQWQIETAWQLRGMAVAADFQQRGVGSALLIAAHKTAREAAIPLLWANVRTTAQPFYAKHGWTVASERFEIPTAGPHVRMLFRL